MITEKGENLVFLLSTPRSGSTLLSSILGGLSEIHCPPEFWLLLPLYAINDPNVFMVTNYDHELARQAWQGLITDDQFLKASRSFAQAIYNQHLEQSGKTILLDKTPRYYHILNWIDELFPLAKKIWLKRNPFDVIASTISSWHIHIQEIVGERLSPHSFDYTLAQLNYLEYFSNMSNNKYVLKYEDLVLNTSVEIRNLCAFLGVEFNADIMEYGRSNTSLLKALSTDLALGDRAVLDHISTHTDSIGKWKSVLSIGETKSILSCLGSKLLKDLGYYNEFLEATNFVQINPLQISKYGRLKDIVHFYETSYTEGQLFYEHVMFTKVSRENVRLRNLLWKNTQSVHPSTKTKNNRYSRYLKKIRAYISSFLNRLRP